MTKWQQETDGSEHNSQRLKCLEVLYWCSWITGNELWILIGPGIEALYISLPRVLSAVWLSMEAFVRHQLGKAKLFRLASDWFMVFFLVNGPKKLQKIAQLHCGTATWSPWLASGIGCVEEAPLSSYLTSTESADSNLTSVPPFKSPNEASTMLFECSSPVIWLFGLGTL